VPKGTALLATSTELLCRQPEPSRAILAPNELLLLSQRCEDPAYRQERDFLGVPRCDGEFDPLSKRVLINEMITFKGGGILPDLSRYLEEEETEEEHTLTAILSNLPFIHRAGTPASITG
jgi:hypothetical protein